MEVNTAQPSLPGDTDGTDQGGDHGDNEDDPEDDDQGDDEDDDWDDEEDEEPGNGNANGPEAFTELGGAVGSPKGYALLGTTGDGVTVGIKAQILDGTVGSNGEVHLHLKSKVGGVLAGGDVTVGMKASAGDISVRGSVTVKRKATTGAITEGASVPTIVLPDVNADPEVGNDIVRNQLDTKDGALTLAPGRYGQLDSALHDHIILQGGTYDFSEFNLDRKSRLTVDLTNGEPLVVRVAGDVNLGIKVRMEAIGGDASDIIFLVGGSKVWLGLNGTYLGTFVAPLGQVIVGIKADLTGAAWGASVWAKKSSTVTYVGYNHPLS